MNFSKEFILSKNHFWISQIWLKLSHCKLETPNTFFVGSNKFETFFEVSEFQRRLQFRSLVSNMPFDTRMLFILLNSNQLDLKTASIGSSFFWIMFVPSSNSKLVFYSCTVYCDTACIDNLCAFQLLLFLFLHM